MRGAQQRAIHTDDMAQWPAYMLIPGKPQGTGGTRSAGGSDQASTAATGACSSTLAGACWAGAPATQPPSGTPIIIIIIIIIIMMSVH
jgi:hypothetical protein